MFFLHELLNMIFENHSHVLESNISNTNSDKDRMICLDTLVLEGNISYTNSDKDRMICLDTLAAYYVQEAKKEKNKEKKKEMFTKVWWKWPNTDLYE